MAKVKVIDPKGILRNGKPVEKGAEFEAVGAELKAWLHFKQVEVIEGKAAPIKNPPDNKPPTGDQAPKVPVTPPPVPPAPPQGQEEAKAALQAKIDARAAELKKLNRKDQDKLAADLKLDKEAVKAAKTESDIIGLIIKFEFGEEAAALNL